MRVLALSLFASTALASSAFAADMPAIAPEVTGHDWSGFYAGVHVGYGWGDADFSAWSNKKELKDLFAYSDVYDYEGNLVPYKNGKDVVGAAVWMLDYEGILDKDGFGIDLEDEVEGFLGGAQVGFNFQSGNFVFGIEGDFSAANLEAETAFNVVSDEAFPEVDFGGALAGEFSVNVNWLSTVRGRIGYAFDNVLVFASGGFAAGDVDIDGALYAGNVHCENLYVSAASFDDSDVRIGYTVGGGIEWAFAESWSVKGEYQFIDLGEEDFSFGEESSMEVDLTLHVVKVGVNYHF